MARPQREQAWLGRRGGSWYIYWYEPGLRQTNKKSLRTNDLVAAEAALSAFNAEFMRPDVTGPVLNWLAWAQRMCKRARENAKQKGRVYSLTPEFVAELIVRQDHRCAVTNMRFSTVVSYRNPFAPSLDQIRAGQGYLPDNVRVVTTIANTAMNGWGEGPLRRMILESRLVDPVERDRLVARTGFEPVLPT